MQLGLVAARGNTDTDTVNFGVSVQNELEDWRHRGRFNALRSREKEETTAERYLLEYNLNYKLSEKSYVFGNLRYERDLFSGFDFQLSETAGYGRLWMPRETLRLELQGGGGARQSRVTDGERRNEGIVRGTFLLRWTFADSAELRQLLTVESGESNTLTESLTSLKTKIVGRLSLKLSFDVKHNSDVPDGVKRTDTLTSVNLVYDF